MKKILILSLFFFACNEGTYFYEDNGFLYFKDNNGDLYLVEGTNKIKVQDYVKPTFTERMELTEFLNLDSINVKIICNLRYMSNSLHYKIKVFDAEGNDIDKTKYYEKFNNNYKWFNVKLQTVDYFTIDSISLDGEGYTRLISSENGIQGYQYEGQRNLSMDDFMLINKISITSYLHKN